MRILKFIFFGLAVMIFQTVVLSRLSLFGSMPDLVLVLVIAFAVVEEQIPATGFAALLGIFQDFLSAGIYLNLLVKILVSNLVSFVKIKFVGDDFFLVGMMVAVCTSTILIIQHMAYFFIFGRPFSGWILIFRLFFETVANVLLSIIVFPIIKDKIIANP